MKQINIKSINEEIKIENITNEINIMEKVSGNQLLAKSKLFPLFYTSFHDSDYINLVMELLEGINLYQY